MVSLKLFVDPYEVEYPTLVREVLADAQKKAGISATITRFGKCALICGNSIYVWSYSSKESAIPHATRMNLPASGLKYSARLISIFSRGLAHKTTICLLAVSPEGNVRFWPEIGKPCRDESCLLNNEVAHSVQLVDSQEHVHRFLLTTTTGSFHMIDIFRSSAGQPERMATRPLDVGGPGGGIGKRMSLFLFGNLASGKEQCVIFNLLSIKSVLWTHNFFSSWLDSDKWCQSMLSVRQIDPMVGEVEQTPFEFKITIITHYLLAAVQWRLFDLPIPGSICLIECIDRNPFLLGIKKTLFVRGKFGPADFVNVLPRYLRFYAIFERKMQLHEVDIADLALSKYNKGRDNVERRHFLILDAEIFRSGILLLLVGALVNNDSAEHDKQIFIGFYEEDRRHEPNAHSTRSLKTLVRVDLPESLCATGLDRRLSHCFLLGPSEEECAIVFSDAFLLVRHPTKSSGASVFCLDAFGDSTEQLLGADVVNGLSHIILKEKGLCTVRRLPEQFDLGFWKKYRSVLLQMEEQPATFVGEECRLNEAFVEFCAKNIKKTKSLLRELDQRMGENESADELGSRTLPESKAENTIAEMSMDLALFLLDRQPSSREDPRWSYAPNAQISNEQRGRLRELSSTKKFTLILRLLGDKHAHYKMAVLFLRTFNLVERLDHPLDTFQNRNGQAVIAELGEKLSAAIFCFHWLAENGESLRLVNSAINELAKKYVTRFGFPKGNPFLSAVDIVFCKVSSFHELVSAVVQLSEQSMEEQADRTNLLMEVGDFLVTLIHGVNEARREQWALHVEDENSTWLNQPDFLTHFTTHLNSALDFLHSATNRSSTVDRTDNVLLNLSQQQNSVIFKQCIQLADFVLSRQSPAQRNDSKIIARFVNLGKADVALELAEKYKDFTMLIVYCHSQLDKKQCAKTLERYKEQYEKDGFHNFLYAWYQQRGMFNQLLAERGKRISDFLAHRHEINWIRQIADGQFGEAKCTLKRMSNDEVDKRKKLIGFSMAKMAALCDDAQNLDEIAELSEQIRALHEP